MMNSSKMMFYVTLVLSITMSISSNNWIMIWCGLEISLISFIPLMISKSLISSESSMKYFIVQSVSSSMLMLGMLIMIMSGDYNYEYLMLSSLMIKMGVPPFHNWVLTVIEGLTYKATIIMLTINKIAPLTLMSYLKFKFMMIIVITIIIGSILSLNQNSIKKMIGYSSIFNMGFLMSVIKNNIMWMVYLFVYSMLLFMLLMITSMNNINYINQMMFSETMINKLTLWVTLLSMGGMPPLVGFSIKYMVMVYMIKMKFILTISTMIMTSLLIMFLYLRITFLTMMNYSVMNKTKLFNLNELSMLLNIMNMITLPSILMVKYI